MADLGDEEEEGGSAGRVSKAARSALVKAKAHARARVSNSLSRGRTAGGAKTNKGSR